MGSSAESAPQDGGTSPDVWRCSPGSEVWFSPFPCTRQYSCIPFTHVAAFSMRHLCASPCFSCVQSEPPFWILLSAGGVCACVG